MEEEKINDIIKAEVFTNCYSSIQIYLQIFMYDIVRNCTSMNV